MTKPKWAVPSGALLLLVVAAVCAYIKVDLAVVVSAAAATILLIAFFTFRVRVHLRWKSGGTSAFSPVGVSGAPLSSQTHLPM